MSHLVEQLPSWVTWQQRPFPDANLLLLDGRAPALVDSGFVGHAADTLAWSTATASAPVALVVNTHWHCDHVGGNALLQAHGAEVVASSLDEQAVGRRDPGCCSAQRLDQPVAPYDVDRAVTDGDVLRLGDSDWQVVATPGHTLGHVCLWQPEERLLATGDALSDYDVGWVDLALDGPGSAATALASLERLTDLGPRVLLTAHGPVPADTGAALATAHRRAQRLVDDPDGAVWYGIRRIFAFALMIREGMVVADVEAYLLERAWLVDAAGLLSRTSEDLAAELVTSMVSGGSVVVRGGRLHAAADHVPVAPGTLEQPWPRDWPPAAS